MKDQPRSWKEGKWVEWAAVLALALLFAGLVYTNAERMRPDHPLFANPWDHHKYIRMAEGGPFDFHIAPFCWRIGVPLLARMMPIDLPASFLLISMICVWLTGPAIYFLCRRAGLCRPYALAGLLFFYSMGWAARFPLMVFWGPDAVSHFLVVLAIVCIFARWDIRFTLILLLGCLVKEDILFVLPLHYSLRARRLIEPRLAVRTLLLGLPAVMLLILIHLVIPALNDDPVYLNSLPETLAQVQDGHSLYQPAQLFRTIGLERLMNIGPREVALYTADTFGLPAVFLVLLLLTSLWWTGRSSDPPGSLTIVLRYLPFLMLVYGQLLFAVNEQRLVVLGFPAVILLALEGWDRLQRRFDFPVWWLFALSGLLALLNTLDRQRPTARMEYQLLLVTLFAATLYVVKRRAR